MADFSGLLNLRLVKTGRGRKGGGVKHLFWKLTFKVIVYFMGEEYIWPSFIQVYLHFCG